MGATPQPVRSGPKPVGAPVEPGKASTLTIQKTKRTSPHRVVIYGAPGVGKSSMAAQAPNPIFIDVNNGLDEIDTDALRPSSWDELLAAHDLLLNDKHEYRTVVLDTANDAETLCQRRVCERSGKDSIEDFGYGKGFTASADEFRVLLARLDELQAKRGMNVILLAHLNQKAFKDPERDAYDRNVGKLHPVVWGLIREWAKEVLFATFETFTKEGDDGRTRGVSSGKRVLRTQWSASYDAKNRHNLPPTIPFEIGKGWEAFTAACAASNT